MSSNDEEQADHAALFQEPEDYFLPEKPATFTEYVLKSGQKLQLRLVGSSPLWGHLLWNAGKIISEYLEDNARELVRDKDVLELGAGAGLPSLVCATLGARHVVITDYPDLELRQNLQHNVEACLGPTEGTSTVVKGYLWGDDTDPLTSGLLHPEGGFDLLILADVVFNHSEHKKLVKTILAALKRDNNAKALVFFTPYRPWLLQKDLAFFDLAREAGLEVEKTMDKAMDKVMFANDPGDEMLRRTVFGYTLKWPPKDPRTRQT